MLIICFVGHRNKYEKLKEQYGKMSSCILTDDWNRFERRLSMLVRELEVFTDIFAQYTKLQEFYKEKTATKEKAEQKIEEYTKSEKASFGFFTKVSREDKIAEYQKLKQECEDKSRVAENLMAIATQVIANEVLNQIKQRKLERFNEIIKEFSDARMRKVQQEIEFWNEICEEDSRLSDVGKKYSSDEIMQQQ